MEQAEKKNESRDNLTLIDEWLDAAYDASWEGPLPLAGGPLQFEEGAGVEGAGVYLVSPEATEATEGKSIKSADYPGLADALRRGARAGYASRKLWGLNDQMALVLRANKLDAAHLHRYRNRLRDYFGGHPFCRQPFEALEDAMLVVEQLECNLSEEQEFPKTGPVRLSLYAKHHGLAPGTLRDRVKRQHNIRHGTVCQIENLGSGIYDSHLLDRWGIHLPVDEWECRPHKMRWAGACSSCKQQGQGGES